MKAELVAALAGAVAVIVPVLVTAYQKLMSKVETVHKLVNSQLADVMAKLNSMTAERDEAVHREATLQATIDEKD